MIRLGPRNDPDPRHTGRVGSFGFVENSEKIDRGVRQRHIAPMTQQNRSNGWRVGEIIAGIRFNDGRVDRLGRFWSGTMIEDGSHANGGSLYSVSCAGNCAATSGRRHFNGLCLSPDGGLWYFADSPTRTIRVFEMIEPAGTGHPAFAQTAEGSVPDGAAIDVTAACGARSGRRLRRRYTPDGRIDRTCMPTASQVVLLRRFRSGHPLLQAPRGKRTRHCMPTPTPEACFSGLAFRVCVSQSTGHEHSRSRQNLTYSIANHRHRHRHRRVFGRQPDPDRGGACRQYGASAWCCAKPSRCSPPRVCWGPAAAHPGAARDKWNLLDPDVLGWLLDGILDGTAH
jgi:hypothetical protein